MKAPKMIERKMVLMTIDDRIAEVKAAKTYCERTSNAWRPKPGDGALVYGHLCGVWAELLAMRATLPQPQGDRGRVLSIAITKAEELLAIIKFYQIDSLAIVGKEEPK